VETTRQTILNILRRRQATVGDLTKELSLAPATVRRHLDILARDGHVNVAQVRRKTGRPHYLFSLSEAGEGLFPKQYVRTTRRLLDEIVALTADETAGRSGVELADLVFEKMAQRLAQRVLPHIHGASLGERVRAAAEALAEEGLGFDIEADGGGYLLTGHGCPCPRVAERGSQVCAHDQRLLSLLLGADVSCVEPEAAGQAAGCSYRVRERRMAEASLPASRSVV
jgi:predicted ArsR family transcriptional regulator